MDFHVLKRFIPFRLGEQAKSLAARRQWLVSRACPSQRSESILCYNVQVPLAASIIFNQSHHFQIGLRLAITENCNLLFLSTGSKFGRSWRLHHEHTVTRSRFTCFVGDLASLSTFTMHWREHPNPRPCLAQPVHPTVLQLFGEN